MAGQRSLEPYVEVRILSPQLSYSANMRFFLIQRD